MAAPSLQKTRSMKMTIGLLLIAAAGISGVLATTIAAITQNKRVEFGQGFYKVKACDSWIRMNIDYGSVQEGDQGLSAFSGITIGSLDTKACANTQLTITVLDKSLEEAALPIYQYHLAPSDFLPLCTQTPCNTTDEATSFTLQIGADGNVILDPTTTSQADITLTASENKGQYSVSFIEPAVLARLVGRLTIQSGVSA